jgi:hypothetical protein
MALYKDRANVGESESEEFDKVYRPGTAAPHAGIYRCVGCGHEIGIARSHILPSQNHPQHSPNQGDIRWKLLVYAQHKND